MNSYTANRHGEYFHYAKAVANSSAAYTNITVASTYGGGSSQSGNVFVPPATESFTHDDDGNLLTDGRWTYSWDGENRLTQMIRDTDTPTGAREKLVFDYDWMGRRIRKRFYTYSSAWVLQSDTIFLYDQWNLICEFDASSSQPGTLIRSYIWGTDLSGSPTGAGGVGGLLKVTDSPLSSPSHHFIAYDGNGNIAALTDGTSGAITARYEYGPFAEPLRTAGSVAKEMPLRFSTKYTDNESGLIYYGYRYYDPRVGRWSSRDPILELGHGQVRPARRPKLGDDQNPFSFARQDPLDLVNPHGDFAWWDCVACAAALIGKFGGTFAGCAYGCSESTSPTYSYGQCLSDCMKTTLTPCQLWKSFKGNPAEWVGAGACVSCGVRAIKDVPKKRPPDCDDCPKPPWRPRVCVYACGSGDSGTSRTRIETFPGEFDGGCPPMQYNDPVYGLLNCLAIGPVDIGWPAAPPPTPGPPGPRAGPIR